MKVLTNLRAVPEAVRPQLDDCIQRALAVGASAPLTYLGAGASGVVFCDWKGRAYKVYRWRTAWAFEGQEAEAEWLMLASSLPELVGLVPMNVQWFPEERVLARDCVDGRPAGWGSKGVRAAYEYIEDVMWPHGWGAPEFKEDSFIITRDGRLVLVDAGSVLRYGENLLNYALEVLAGQRRQPESNQDLIFAIRVSIMDGEVPREEGERLLALLGDTEAPPGALDGVDPDALLPQDESALIRAEEKALARTLEDLQLVELGGRPFWASNSETQRQLLTRLHEMAAESMSRIRRWTLETGVAQNMRKSGYLPRSRR